MSNKQRQQDQKKSAVWDEDVSGAVPTLVTGEEEKQLLEQMKKDEEKRDRRRAGQEE